MGARDLYIEEANTALDIFRFEVFFKQIFSSQIFLDKIEFSNSTPDKPRCALAQPQIVFIRNFLIAKLSSS